MTDNAKHDREIARTDLPGAAPHGELADRKSADAAPGTGGAPLGASSQKVGRTMTLPGTAGGAMVSPPPATPSVD